MQIQTQRLELSLKALALSPKEALASSPRASPRNHITFPPTINADYSGTESCVDLIQNDDRFAHGTGTGGAEEAKHKSATSSRSCGPMSMRKQKVQKEFPPPMPLLARTQNLHSHMPWVLKRYYTADGRLILKEERVRHHEYFRAHRANGRLTLQLVPLDDHVLDTLPPFYDHNVNDVDDDVEVQRISTPRETNEPANDACTDHEEKRIVGDDEVHLENEKAVVGVEYDNNGSGAKCLNCGLQYAFFGVPLASN